MKIIVAESAYRDNKNANSALSITKSFPRIWLKADSALLTHGKPMFAPDFTQKLSASLYVALRISRMGKSIPARFAHRYFDGVAVAVDFTAEDLLRQLRAQGEPWDIAKSFDGSVCIGDFEEVSLMDSPFSVALSLHINGVEQSTITAADLKAFAAPIIEQVSQCFTLRQGDILLLGQPTARPLVHINCHIEGKLNGRVLTKFNVK